MDITFVYIQTWIKQRKMQLGITAVYVQTTSFWKDCKGRKFIHGYLLWFNIIHKRVTSISLKGLCTVSKRFAPQVEDIQVGSFAIIQHTVGGYSRPLLLRNLRILLMRLCAKMLKIWIIEETLCIGDDVANYQKMNSFAEDGSLGED